MDTFDLKRLYEGLHAGTELTGVAVVVQTVDGEDGPAVFVVHDVGDERALEAPVVAVLHLLVDDALGVELLGQAVGGLAALEHLLVGDVAGALGVLHDVQADLAQGVLTFSSAM